VGTLVEAGVIGRAGARRAVAGLALGALAALALAGCAKSAEASSLPTPAVVWEKGEPTGPEWGSEWATAYKEAVIQLSAARAYADFSDPDLVAALGYDEAQVAATDAARDRFDSKSEGYAFEKLRGTYAFWGGIVKVDESADGSSATVYGCEAAIRSHVGLVPTPDTAVVTRTSDGGFAVEWASDLNHPNTCNAATIWVATWAAPIDLTDVGRSSVKKPLPRDYYVKLGVISK